MSSASQRSRKRKKKRSNSKGAMKLLPLTVPWSAKASSIGRRTRSRNKVRLPPAAETCREGSAFSSFRQGESEAMPLPHDALVLVADGRKMLFFRNQGDANQIDLRTERHDAPRLHRNDPEIKSDAPATTNHS